MKETSLVTGTVGLRHVKWHTCFTPFLGSHPHCVGQIVCRFHGKLSVSGTLISSLSLQCDIIRHCKVLAFLVPSLFHHLIYLFGTTCIVAQV